MGNHSKGSSEIKAKLNEVPSQHETFILVLESILMILLFQPNEYDVVALSDAAKCHSLWICRKIAVQLTDLQTICSQKNHKKSGTETVKRKQKEKANKKYQNKKETNPDTNFLYV